MARTKNGTMTLREDDRGVVLDAQLDPERPDVQVLALALKRGDLDQCSMAFVCTDDTWESGEDGEHRIIRSLSLHRRDISICNRGASPSTTVSIRSGSQTPVRRRSTAELRLIRALQETVVEKYRRKLR
jgi:uncharacterized protein